MTTAPEHLKYVLQYCNSISKGKIFFLGETVKVVGRKRPVTNIFSYITLFTWYGIVWYGMVPKMFHRRHYRRTLYCKFSVKHENLCHRSGCITETKCARQLGKLETAASICTIIKMWWAGCAGRSSRWHKQMEKGQECCCLLWLLWWERRWNVWIQRHCN